MKLGLTTFALVAFGSVALGAELPSSTIHADPATDDNLRVYAFVDPPGATFIMDGGSPGHLDGMSVTFTRIAPGHHEANVILPDGSQAALAFDLSVEGSIESKGRRWWCLAAGRQDGRLKLLQFEAAQCKSIVDSGPN